MVNSPVDDNGAWVAEGEGAADCFAQIGAWVVGGYDKGESSVGVACRCSGSFRLPVPSFRREEKKRNPAEDDQADNCNRDPVWPQVFHEKRHVAS